MGELSVSWRRLSRRRLWDRAMPENDSLKLLRRSKVLARLTLGVWLRPLRAVLMGWSLVRLRREELRVMGWEGMSSTASGSHQVVSSDASVIGEAGGEALKARSHMSSVLALLLRAEAELELDCEAVESVRWVNCVEGVSKLTSFVPLPYPCTTIS